MYKTHQHDKKNVPQGLCIKICIHMHKICIKVHIQYGKKLMRNECIKYAFKKIDNK